MTRTAESSIRLSSALLILILGGLQTVMPISTDLYLPALPTIARDLNVSPGVAQFTMAVFMIGVAIGQIVYGPITDKYGRKKPLLIGLAIYILGALLCAFATSINTLIGGRFLQALGAAAGAVITATIARDLWSGKVLADRLSLLFLVIGVAPILAPSLGGLILTLWDWHGMFWFLVVFGALVAISVTLLPETSSAQERAQVRLRDAAGTYAALLRNPSFMLFVLTGACTVGMLFAYITGSSFIYIETLGVTPGLFAILFGVNAAGFIGASQLNRVLLRHFSVFAITRTAVIAGVFVALLLVVVVANECANTFTLTILFILLCAAIGFIIPNIAALAIGTVKERMGSASALQGTMQSIFGGIAGGLVGALGNGSTLPVIVIIAGFAGLAAAFLLVAHRKQPDTPMPPQPLPDALNQLG